jgi:glycine/D-amino acid oxidase-like deaminating enzyme
MKAAVVGAGLAGMAVVTFLLEKGCEVVLFDHQGVGGFASGIAAGLLHPFTAKLKPKWIGQEALRACIDLLDYASSSVYKKSGILKKGSFETADSNIEQIDKDLFLIKEGYVVDIPSYLNKLFEKGIKKGLQFEQRQIEDLKELNGFDAVYLCTGALANQMKGVFLPLYSIKGQIAIVETKEVCDIPKMQKGYLLKSNGQVIWGATFEKEFTTIDPDEAVFKKRMETEFDIDRIVEIKASLRSYHRSLRPLCLMINHNTFFLGGLGSRGLLYHAYLAKQCTLFDTKTSFATKELR